MKVEFQKALVDMGLDEKAAAVYLALLGTNKLSATEIAKSTGIKRATCYEHLEMLLKKDFVARVPIGKRMLYAAVSPKKILNEFKKKQVHFEQKVDEMESLRDQSIGRPKVTYYEGKREIKKIYDDLFKTVGDVQSIFPAEQFFQNFSEQDYVDFDTAVQKHALNTRDLFVADGAYRKLSELRSKSSSVGPSKRLPKDFVSNVDVLIFSDKVALISLRDLSAIVIDNKDIADLFRNLHSFVWRTL